MYHDMFLLSTNSSSLEKGLLFQSKTFEKNFYLTKIFGLFLKFWYTNTEVSCPGPEIIKLFSYSTQLSIKCIMLINDKMPTIIGMILTFISMINTTSENLKARKF